MVFRKIQLYKNNFIEFGNDFNLSTSVYKKHEF